MVKSPRKKCLLKNDLAFEQIKEVSLETQVVMTTIQNTPIYRNFIRNLPRNTKLSQLSKDKRKEGILSEVLFWQEVHKGKFHKIDFDRQRIIGNYIVDFYVKSLGLEVMTTKKNMILNGKPI